LPSVGILSGVLVGLDELDNIINRAYLFKLLIGDLDAELVLNGHGKIDQVQAVGAEVLPDGGLEGNIVLLDIEMLRNDLAYLLKSHIARSFLFFAVRACTRPTKEWYAFALFLSSEAGGPRAARPCGLMTTGCPPAARSFYAQAVASCAANAVFMQSSRIFLL